MVQAEGLKVNNIITKEEIMMMDFHVTNENICVNEIRMFTLGLGSVLKVGDTQSIQMFSTFDTPPEALIIGLFSQIAAGAGVVPGVVAGAATHGGTVRGGV